MHGNNKSTHIDKAFLGHQLLDIQFLHLIHERVVLLDHIANLA
jgi:hypothetical protein